MLSYNNRENINIVNTNQGDTHNFGIEGDFSYEDKLIPSQDNYSIIIVSKNREVHKALLNTLRHFSLEGKGINIFNVSSMHEANVVAEEYPDVVLVVIDESLSINGSYEVFVDFIKNELQNKNCHITFKDQLVSSTKIHRSNNKKGLSYARERLIEITRMVLLTHDMENKIGDEDLDYPSRGNHPKKDENKGITRDMLYTFLSQNLKGPVGNIKVMLDFLTNEPELLDKKSSKDLLQRVHESANNIHETLQDFNFWSRMIKQDISFNPVKIDLDFVIRQNIMLLKSTAADKMISLNFSVPPHAEVIADEYMVTTVIRNLIYNAIKFTSPAGSIKIFAVEKSSHFEIRVCDNGSGIPEDCLKNLFNAEVCSSAPGTSLESGSGLGLVLCKDFVEKNGGTLQVKSRLDVGSEFTFTLPKYK